MHFDILTTNSSNARLLHAVKYSPNPVWPKVGPPTVVSATLHLQLSHCHTVTLHPQLSHCHTATLSTMPHCTQPLFQLSTSQRQNYFLPLITFCNNFQFSVYFRSGMMYKKLILKARYITTQFRLFWNVLKIVQYLIFIRKKLEVQISERCR